MTSHVLMKYLQIKCQTKMYYQAPKYSLAFNYGYKKPQWNLSWNLQISSGDFRSVACNTMKLYIVSDGYTNCTNLKVACSERSSSFSYFTYINLGCRKLPLTGYGPSFLPLVEKLPVNSAAGVGLSCAPFLCQPLDFWIAKKSSMQIPPFSQGNEGKAKEKILLPTQPRWKEGG